MSAAGCFKSGGVLGVIFIFLELGLALVVLDLVQNHLRSEEKKKKNHNKKADQLTNQPTKAAPKRWLLDTPLRYIHVCEEKKVLYYTVNCLNSFYSVVGAECAITKRQ